ncbi:MAG TPA: transketolase C-terminal domain-containing protein, partial [Geothrix sp.]|nr:transketolase C-terminal domain-containing protein [Geothrix sp.]
EAVSDLDVAVLDLRTLWPLDDDAIAALARRTHRVLVLTEASGTYGPGAELAARVGETCFPWLDAPVLRVGAADTPTPASPPLEAAFLPGPARVRAELDRLLAW